MAIRTAEVDLGTGAVAYGTGGGITWDSDPAAEWEEALAKARVLEADPELAQMPRDRALQILTDAGLKWKISEEESTEFAPGSVIRQAPAAGATVPKGTEMVITLAKAPSVVRVPDLTGVILYAAQDRLKAAGIQVGTITQVPSPDYHHGTVIAQDPTAGTVVTPSTKVNLTVAARG